MAKVFGDFPENYELIDAGASLKLERWGETVTIRPDLQAYFHTAKPLSEWRKMADFEFVPQSKAGLTGTWKMLKDEGETTWEFSNAVFSVYLEASGNKHIGLFPEQQYNWNFIGDHLQNGQRFLNLFAYTGASSLCAAGFGAEVTHVDSVRGMIEKARKNMELNNVSGIRWVVEDALKFVNREQKRGNVYDMIQLDPPAFGLGAKGEKWKLENLLPDLLSACLQILKPGGRIILSTYTPKLGERELRSLIKADPLAGAENTVELWMKTTTGKELFYGLVSHIQRRR